MQKSFKNRALTGILILGLLVGFLPTKLVYAAEEHHYTDLIIKVHVNTLEGRLYSFNPENANHSSPAFLQDYDPTQTPLDYDRNRDFARSLFLKIAAPEPLDIQVFDPNIEQSYADLLLMNAGSFAENKDGDEFFLLSPQDGFLHFKVIDTFASVLNIEITSSLNTAPFRIYEDLSMAEIVRKETPYGYFDNPPQWIFSEQIDFGKIAADTKKIQSDLVIMQNEDVDIIKYLPDPTGFSWLPDEMVTFAQKFTLRAHHALDWTLKIDNYGVDHSSISDYYKKIINTANALLILIILVIAFLWNFSAIVSKATLRRMLILYAIVSIVVNLSAPFVKLLIDGSNILQDTFLQTTEKGEVRHIVADDFFDYKKIEYDNIAGYALEDSTPIYRQGYITEGTIVGDPKTLDYSGIKAEIAYGTSTIVGSLGSLVNNITVTDGTGGTATANGTVDMSGISLNYAPTTATATFQGDATLSKTSDSTTTVTKIPVQQRLEDRVFNTAMLILTGIGYFLITGLLLFRIVILWFLVILSPLLFLLTILPFAREYFRYWLWLFVRWIAVGPLLAIGIGATIFIWKAVGIPLTSLYSSNIEFSQSSNFLIASPGSSSPGLNYTKPMMEYIVGLIMLYLPVLLAFWLTRKIPCTNCSDKDKGNSPFSLFGFFKPKNPLPEAITPPSGPVNNANPPKTGIIPELRGAPLFNGEKHLDTEKIKDISFIQTKEKSFEQIEKVRAAETQVSQKKDTVVSKEKKQETIKAKETSVVAEKNLSAKVSAVVAKEREAQLPPATKATEVVQEQVQEEALNVATVAEQKEAKIVAETTPAIEVETPSPVSEKTLQMGGESSKKAVEAEEDDDLLAKILNKPTVAKSQPVDLPEDDDALIDAKRVARKSGEMYLEAKDPETEQREEGATKKIVTNLKNIEDDDEAVIEEKTVAEQIKAAGKVDVAAQEAGNAQQEAEDDDLDDLLDESAEDEENVKKAKKAVEKWEEMEEEDDQDNPKGNLGKNTKMLDD